ncbi:hypothetical protein EDC04DRAFT_367963 [Pisolithus marmoratus]|nr:hypothetical protein EDC04DRAFT_367963 [Pisolithus marmoratus]
MHVLVFLPLQVFPACASPPRVCCPLGPKPNEEFLVEMRLQNYEPNKPEEERTTQQPLNIFALQHCSRGLLCRCQLGGADDSLTQWLAMWGACEACHGILFNFGRSSWSYPHILFDRATIFVRHIFSFLLN